MLITEQDILQRTNKKKSNSLALLNTLNFTSFAFVAKPADTIDLLAEKANS